MLAIRLQYTINAHLEDQGITTPAAIDDVRDAVRTFVDRYNAEWLIEKNGHRSPADMRTAWQEETFRRAA